MFYSKVFMHKLKNVLLHDSLVGESLGQSKWCPQKISQSEATVKLSIWKRALSWPFPQNITNLQIHLAQFFSFSEVRLNCTFFLNIPKCLVTNQKHEFSANQRLVKYRTQKYCNNGGVNKIRHFACERDFSVFRIVPV